MGFHYLVLVSLVISCAVADTAKDTEECRNQLVGVATCLPYVEGEAKSPTPDCCNGLKQLLKDDMKCLCVIFRDRNDPELGLNINVTIALGLPSVCHSPANLSQCPALLHMDPNSPEAQVFYQFAKNYTHGASSPAPSPTAGRPGNSIGASKGTSSDGWCSGKRWQGLEIVSGGVLLFYFMS